MASQLIGECVIFNVAFVGPARSGKSLFINRWHSLQTIGMIEAVDNVHQLRYAGGELMAPVGAASTSSGGGGGGGVRGADHSGEGTAAAHAARRRSSARRSSVFVSANQIQAVMALEKEQSSAAGGAGAGPLDDDAQFSRDGSLLSVLDSTSDTWPSDPASAKSRPFDDDHDHDHGAGFEAFPVATRRPTASGGGPASPVRGSDGRYVPTDYSRVVRSSVVLADCASAAVHRMFLYDTPGHVDRFSIPAALLSGRSIKVRLSGAVVCVDDDEMSRDPAAAAQVRALIDLCEKFGTAALVIYRGAPLPAEFRGRDDVRTMFVACAKDDFAQSSKAFSAFLSQLHAVELRSR